MLAGLIYGVPREEVLSPNWKPINRLRDDAPFHADVESIIGGSFREKQPPEIVAGAYVVETLETALWAFHSAPNYRQAVLAAVNLGDDSDTAGAICGQLAGAYWGETGIPQEWLLGLGKRQMIDKGLAHLGCKSQAV